MILPLPFWTLLIKPNNINQLSRNRAYPEAILADLRSEIRVEAFSPIARR